MTLGLRQVALVARDLDRAVADLSDVFGLGAPFHDPGVAVFGLRNAVFALGATFLEVVSPVREDASATRFLASKGGDAGYMVILQTDDLAREHRRLAELSVRVVFETELDDIATLHLHPRDIGGAIVSLDEARPPQSWRRAGPHWRQRASEHVDGIAAVEIASLQPERTAARWAQVLGRSRPHVDGSCFVLALDSGVLRFSRCSVAHEEGVVRVELRTHAREHILAAATKRAVRASCDEVLVCGVRFRLLG